MKLLFTLIFALPLTLFADVVYLTNGKRIEGVVDCVTNDAVTLRVPAGKMTLNRAQIARIVCASSPIEEFNARAAELKRNCTDCAKDWQALAAFAEQNGLTREALDAYSNVLLHDPDNAKARLALGYKYYNGVWLTQADYIRAAGLVRYNNAWVPREEAARLAALDAEARMTQAQANADAARADVNRAQSDVNRTLSIGAQTCAYPCSATILRNFEF